MNFLLKLRFIKKYHEAIRLHEKFLFKFFKIFSRLKGNAITEGAGVAHTQVTLYLWSELILTINFIQTTLPDTIYI